MKLFVKWLCFVIVLALPVAIQAETKKTTAPAPTSVEKIQNMLEYHQKMVGMIQSYMKDRTQIPADYRAVSDTEFLKKARSEKMAMAAKASGGAAPAASAKPTPVKATSGTRY